jgi:hypothetical protein
MTPAPDCLSTFVRFVQLKSLRKRTEEEYVRWVRRIARHCGVACASLLSEEEVLGFLHHLQQHHDYEGSTLNQAVCGLRLFFRDHLGRAAWTCWSQIKTQQICLSLLHSLMIIPPTRERLSPEPDWHQFFSRFF